MLVSYIYCTTMDALIFGKSGVLLQQGIQTQPRLVLGKDVLLHYIDFQLVIEVVSETRGVTL